MLFNNLALLGALALLPLSYGQPRGNFGHHEFPQTRNGRLFPPLARKHQGLPRHGDDISPPNPPPHHGLLRHRLRESNETTTEGKPQTTTTPPAPVNSRIDCGDNPLVRQTEGCPCFNLETLTSQIDLKSVDYCDLYASTPVDEDDQCKHLYPPAYASFSASQYTETEDFGMFFGYDTHYDPEMTGGYCHGEVYNYIYNYDDGDYGDYDGQSHSFSLGIEVTQEELKECEKVFEELEAKLEDNPNCFVSIGGGYYY